MTAPANSIDASDAAGGRGARVCLVAQDGMATTSGGYRYQQHLLDAAPDHGVAMWSQCPRWRLPPMADVVVLDSLEAWKAIASCFAPGPRGRGGRRPHLVGLVHQHPGGVDCGRVMRAFKARLDVAVYRRCDVVIATAANLAANLADLHGVRRERIVLIRPGCDLPPHGLVPPLRAGRRLGLLNVANWLPNKGIVDLLDAVATLPADDVTLHLVGRIDVDPGYRATVEHRLGRPDLAGRVVVHGSLPAAEVAALYAAADAFAFPSRVEAYGTVAAEAIAAALPVIGWDTAHLRDHVDNGAEGLLAPAGNIEAFALSVHRLATDDLLRRRLADGAALRGEELPTWSQTVTAFFDLMTRLAGTAGTG